LASARDVEGLPALKDTEHSLTDSSLSRISESVHFSSSFLLLLAFLCLFCAIILPPSRLPVFTDGERDSRINGFRGVSRRVVLPFLKERFAPTNENTYRLKGRSLFEVSLSLSLCASPVSVSAFSLSFSCAISRYHVSCYFSIRSRKKSAGF